MLRTRPGGVWKSSFFASNADIMNNNPSSHYTELNVILVLQFHMNVQCAFISITNKNKVSLIFLGGVDADDIMTILPRNCSGRPSLFFILDDVWCNTGIHLSPKPPPCLSNDWSRESPGSCRDPLMNGGRRKGAFTNPPLEDRARGHTLREGCH